MKKKIQIIENVNDKEKAIWRALRKDLQLAEESCQ